MRISRHMMCALALRLLLVAYGEHQDRSSALPYTDVDYHVFNDAARLVRGGQSPYRRSTYRYTPLLAWLLVLDVPQLGKWFFSVCDVLVGRLLLELVRGQGYGRRWALAAASVWWYNPLAIGVCSRGSAESLVLALVLAALLALQHRCRLLAGLALGVAVHFKIYPVVLAPALYWSLAPTGGVPWWRYWLWPSASRLRLVAAAVLSFTALTTLCWFIYGWEFVEHTYLYHLTRRDVRHNFSVFFYLLYLTDEFHHWALGLVSFLPQLVIILALAVRFHRPQHLVFCAFCQVYVFVTFNKVCTSQYFLWYLSLLPACMPRLALERREAVGLLALWYLAQAFWLLPAYLLEFQGRSVMRLVWAESLAFFCANAGILARLIRKYDEF